MLPYSARRPPEFSFIDRPRPGPMDSDHRGGGGGLVIIYRGSFCVKRITLSSFQTTFEACAASISTRRGPCMILTVYRPGFSSPSQTFFDEFATVLEQLALYNSQVVIVGDFDLHLENTTSLLAADFRTFINQFRLIQHVAEPTHRHGGWLDIVITTSTISDHGLVTTTIHFFMLLCQSSLRRS